MRILLAAATPGEVAPIVDRFRPVWTMGSAAKVYRCGDHDIDVLVTGVGMTATAAWCSRVLAAVRYDLALNVGVCGSFRREIAPGDVVHVVSDCIPELGAEDGHAFLTVQEMTLLGENDPPFSGGRLVNARPPRNAALDTLRTAAGITVNTVHGREQTIAEVVGRFDPDVESMEGAAFMFSCLIHEVPFAQVRAVSNLVEPRNPSAWRMTEALEQLRGATLGIIGSS